MLNFHCLGLCLLNCYCYFISLLYSCLLNLKKFSCILVFYFILDTLSRMDPGDPRGADYAEVISLIHRCFFFCEIVGNEALSFADLACQMNIELVGTCKTLYNQIKLAPGFGFNAACFWLAAIHAVLQEPIEDIETLMHDCPRFAENLFSIIDESNFMYFEYIQHAYECVGYLDGEDISAKLQYLECLRQSFGCGVNEEIEEDELGSGLAID